MEELLPYYESELGNLRRDLREFAERYPKIAARLLISGDVCEDPHTERLIEAFALLNGRIAKRLDDDYPELTQALFEVLYPHYLRPFPSCSIARMDKIDTPQQTLAGEVARGTELHTLPVQGGPCVFRTVYPVALLPLALTHAQFSDILRLPESVRAPPAASASISLTIAGSAAPGRFDQLGAPRLRVFIDGEPSFCAALRDALFMRTVAAWVQADDSGHWQALPAIPLQAVGLQEDEALIDFPAASHAAYRLLTEYFCFPEKFNFFDIDLAALGAALPGARSITLHLALSGIRSDSNLARMLGTLSPKHLLLGCTPVVNLFRQRGEPIRVTHMEASYPIVADSRRPFAFEVHAVESLSLTRQTPYGDSVVPFRPFYGLEHGQTPEQHGHYYVVRRDPQLARHSPGFEARLSIVDIDFDPAAVETATLSLELRCSNRDLPSLLPYNQPQGDLFMQGGAKTGNVYLLRKPSPCWRFPSGRSAHWRLLSHLALNHLSLSAGGVAALREMLALYDLPRSPSSQRQIGGIVSVTQQASTAWMAGNPFNCLVRGVQVRVMIDPEAFIGSGIHAFAQVLAQFLALYVHVNSFTQLVLVSANNAEELLVCPPQSGALNLL